MVEPFVQENKTKLRSLHRITLSRLQKSKIILQQQNTRSRPVTNFGQMHASIKPVRSSYISVSNNQSVQHKSQCAPFKFTKNPELIKSGYEVTNFSTYIDDPEKIKILANYRIYNREITTKYLKRTASIKSKKHCY